MNIHSNNYEFGALERDGDRGRHGLAPCHGFGRILGSVFDAKSIKKMKLSNPKNIPHSNTQQLENVTRMETKMHPKSMTKGINNQY